MKKQTATEFEKAAAKSSGGLAGEFWGFLKTNKKWWLLPMVIAFVVLALLVFLAGTGIAPFIYTLF